LTAAATKEFDDTVDPAQIPALPSLIAAPRLAPYLTACAGDTAQAARLYTWNITVSAAFWGPMHALEVVLRNALNAQLAQHFGRNDWWTSPRATLNRPMSGQRDQAITDAAKAAQRRASHPVADDVVAALSFGFWTGLLGSGSQRSGPHLQYETRYWQPALTRAFPNYTGRRAALHTRLDYLRVFRNRLAHHEPVFSRHLQADHDTIIDLARLIHHDAATYIDTQSRVPEVLADRARAVGTGQGTSF